MKNRELSNVTLGSKVKTELGDGIVVGIQQQFNGLQIVEDTEEIIVWFPLNTRRKWLSFKFHYSQVELLS